jgi:hypothetical protein
MAHGKQTRLIIGGYDLQITGYSVRAQFSKDLAENDTFGDPEHRSEAGIKGGVFTVDQRFKGSIDETQKIIADMQTDILAHPHVLYGPAGLAVGDTVFIADSHHNSCEVSGDTKSVVTVNCMFTADGGVYSGILLVSPYA